MVRGMHHDEIPVHKDLFVELDAEVMQSTVVELNLECKLLLQLPMQTDLSL